MNWEEAVPYLVIGGIILAVIMATRPSPPLVVGGPTPPSPETETARLEAAVRLAEVAVQRDLARWQAEAIARQYEAERILRERELEAERERARLEAEVAKKGAETQFWGNFWGGFFGLVGSGLALLAGLSEPVLYDRAFYRPDRGSGGQLLALRRDYGYHR